MSYENKNTSTPNYASKSSDSFSLDGASGEPWEYNDSQYTYNDSRLLYNYFSSSPLVNYETKH